MKVIMAILGFFFKLLLIGLYCCTKGVELILAAFNTAFQKLMEK